MDLSASSPRASINLGWLRAALWLVAICSVSVAADAAEPVYLSPTALAPSPDGKRLYVACATASQVKVFDLAARRVARTVEVPAEPTGLTVSADGARLYVTCGGRAGWVVVVDAGTGKILSSLAAGHTAMAPVLSPDGKTLYACNRFDNNVSVIDLAAGRATSRIAVQREPVAAAITPDGKWLLVANFLHTGAADAGRVGAVVSVIGTAAGKVVKELALPNGSGVLNDIRVSPDGRYAVVTHLLSRFTLPTTQLERGWMNTNAKTIVDLEQMEIVNTVLLDSVDCGAANPWGIAWSADGRTVAVALAGTHELSVTDFPRLLAKLAALPAEAGSNARYDDKAPSHVQSDVPNDLSFLAGVRRRIKLPETDRGSRAVAIIGSKAYVANYFSDTISIVDLTSQPPQIESFPLGPQRALTSVRQGELYFHDAKLCFQGWQSCASCHPGGARVDALNWDLVNDGIGNPKNTRSLLHTHETPPAMSLGVRESAETAVRAGIRHILLSTQPEPVAQAIDAYLRQLRPVPSPRLVNGELSAAARRGQRLFDSAAVGCADCHKGKLHTDLQTYDVGTRGNYDQPGDQFDTPALTETWRTAPYLHDGSAATLQEVLTIHNRTDKHGHTSQLTPQQIDDLAEYVLSL